MKILLVYVDQGKIGQYAKSLAEGAERAGHQVTLKKTKEGGELVTCHAYDLLIVGSPIKGLLGGKIPEEIREFLTRLKRTEGQIAVAFSNKRLIGTDKGLRRLMGAMESQGSLVNDFRSFKSSNEAEQFGRGL